MEVLLQPDGRHAAFGPPSGLGRVRSTPSPLAASPSRGSVVDDHDDDAAATERCHRVSRVLSTPPPLSASPPRGSSGSGFVVDDRDDVPAATAERRRRLARLAHSYHDVIAHLELCLSCLADASNEVAALRRENHQLRVANEDLARHIKMVRGKDADEIGSLRLAEENTWPLPTTSSVVAAAEAMPKSISVRSPGYHQIHHNGGSHQRMFSGMDGRIKGVGEEKKLGVGLDFEVYTQGTYKTELCQHWENGWCPYGDQCHFAHGVPDLHPVIRHPRYKTEICRWVLAGALCPYGNRCHFHHSITPLDLA